MITAGLEVMRERCATCIYRPDSPLDLEKLENDVRDPHIGFRGYRICHHNQPPAFSKND